MLIDFVCYLRFIIVCGSILLACAIVKGLGEIGSISNLLRILLAIRVCGAGRS